MSNEPEKKNLFYENFILAWSRLGEIRKIIERLTNRKAFKDVPETIKDDILEVRDIAQGRPKEEE